MDWLQHFSDNNIMHLIDVVKSDYFMAATGVLAIATVLVKKTEIAWDNKIVAWLKKKLGR